MVVRFKYVWVCMTITFEAEKKIIFFCHSLCNVFIDNLKTNEIFVDTIKIL